MFMIYAFYQKYLDQVELDVSEYISESNDNLDENMLMLRNLYKYQSEQVKKIEKSKSNRK